MRFLHGLLALAAIAFAPDTGALSGGPISPGGTIDDPPNSVLAGGQQESSIASTSSADPAAPHDPGPTDVSHSAQLGSGDDGGHGACNPQMSG